MAEPETPPDLPGGATRGCLFALGVALLILGAGIVSFWWQRDDFGVWATRKGIASQTWSEHTKRRAHTAIDRYVTAHQEGRISGEDRDRLRPILDGFQEAAGEGSSVPEDQAVRLLDQWDAWLEEVERER